MPGHPRVLAKDLVEQLREQALEQFDVPVHLETTAETIDWEDDIVVLRTNTDCRRPAHAHRRSSPAATARSSPRSCPATT